MASTSELPIGIFSTAFVVPREELRLNLDFLSQINFGKEKIKFQPKFHVHSNVYKQKLFFSGSDEERAHSFWDLAVRPDLHVLWGARGGYGTLRTLEHLKRLVKDGDRDLDKKLVVGFSDLTILQAYVGDRWGWSVLHAPMLASRNLSLRGTARWKTVFEAIALWNITRSWKSVPVGMFKTDRLSLKPVYLPRGFKQVQGRLIGGNLASWVSMLGGSHNPKCEGSVLFFEDVGEDLYRLDRILQILRLSGGLRGVQAIVLGSFTQCEDMPANCLRVNVAKLSAAKRKRILTSPKPSELKPLRKALSTTKGIEMIFSELGEREGIPILSGLPVGHDPKINEPLILNEIFSLKAKHGGRFEFERCV